MSTARFSWALAVSILLLAGIEVAQGQGLREGSETLAKELLVKLPTDRRLTLAVTEFTDLQGVTSDLSRYIAERLTTTFSQSQRAAVVERRRLAQVLAELGWSQGDILDPGKAPRIGQMAGVDGVMVGTITDLGAAVEIEARLVALESGQVLVAATATIPKDESVGTLMARGRQVPAPPPRPEVPKSLPEASGVPALESVSGNVLIYSTPRGRWRYDITLVREEGLLFKRKVSQRGTWTLVNDGLVPFRQSEAFRLRGEYQVGTAVRRETFYYRLSDEVVEQVGEEHQLPDGQRMSVTYEPPILLWRAGAKTGDQWGTTFQKSVQEGVPRTPGGAVTTTPGGTTIRLDVLLKGLLEGLFAGIASSGEGGNAVKVIVGPAEKISIPLGDFDGQRVEFQRGSLTIQDWHVPAMGLAKRSMVGPKGRMEAELVEFFIPQ